MRVSPTATRATLLPQAAAQLAPVSNQLGAGARGDRSQADAVRRGLGVDGLVLCTMTLVAARYDARCTLHTGLGEPRSAVASFLPGEPLGAHAQRIWQGLSAPVEVTIGPGDLGAKGARQSTALLDNDCVGFKFTARLWLVSVADTCSTPAASKPSDMIPPYPTSKRQVRSLRLSLTRP